jgi:hypothetical protein
MAAHLGFDCVVAGHNRDGFGNAMILPYLAVTFSVHRLLPRPVRSGPACPGPGRPGLAA